MRMLRIILSHFIKRATWAYHSIYLRSMNGMEQFLSYIQRSKPKNFIFYKDLSSQKRTEFLAVMDELGINLKGTRFLDIGPAYGDSLDICREKEAAVIDFVEYDPVFFTFNKLKGYTKGYQLNHLWKLKKLQGNTYDIIWIKGSIIADFFITGKIVSLTRWLTQVEALASPTCCIIICPFWFNDEQKRNIEDVRHNAFTDIMLNRGYVILPSIENHNADPAFPVTFMKKITL
ncbi:MAG: hypothetical protein HZB33_14320 [Nitrospirae bacterium]|nr:hypothetical protein [Nitrospirota bacterium]